MASAKNEVAILKCLKHPNVVLYFDSFVSDNIFYIVMEYATKGSLYDFIKRNKPNLLSQQTVLNYFCQILNGLHHIHSKNIIHRDLKAENIFLTGLQADVVKIGDFGISKILQNETKTQTFIGTANYLAPEMCHGKPYNTKSDIWSLGCILYELCALERMFDGPVANVVYSISTGRKKLINSSLYETGVQYLVEVMLQLEPANRPDTVSLMKFPVLLQTMYTLGVTLGCIKF
ncbi:serine/threonine-protein kinase Nek8-like isoform X2 [Photinus pyralis]|nr:serine/threonine-protein kinase Nek8-like isoform X2 [Photinus pyralis]